MNRKMKIMLGVLAFAALAALVGTGLYLRFGLQVLDNPGMEDPAAPMLELLSARWTSEDGLWEAQIKGCSLELRHRQDLVYSGSFTFEFHGDDVNVRTELDVSDTQFASEDGSVCGTLESLYAENGRLYLDITVSNEGKDSVRQQIVLNRAQPGEPESEEIREVSEMAELVEFTWNQNGMSRADCFQFRIYTTEHDLSDPRLYCRYTDPETYERVEIGDDDTIGFQGFGLGGTRIAENETWLPVSPGRWAELADFLRKAELSAYFAPPPGLMDATNSIIAVTWREDGEEFTNRYGGGTSARDLLKLLQDIAREASRKAQEPAASAGWTCSCGQGDNNGKFCTECGQPKPAGAPQYKCGKCGKCGWEPVDPTKPPNFCPECGDPFDDGDMQ